MIQPGSQAPLTIRLSSATEDVITVTGQAINTLDLNKLVAGKLKMSPEQVLAEATSAVGHEEAAEKSRQRHGAANHEE